MSGQIDEEKKLWEGIPVKEMVAKTFNNMIIIFTLCFLMPMLIVSFILGFSDFIVTGTFSRIDVIMAIFIGGVGFFLIILLYVLTKSQIKDKYNREKYQITTKKISLKSQYAGLGIKTESIKEIFVKDIFQYHIFKGFWERRYNFNTGSLYLYVNYSSIPTLLMSYFSDPEKVNIILNSFLIQKRLDELQAKNQKPFPIIEWKQDKDNSTIIITTLFKIGLIWGISILIFFYIFYFYSLIADAFVLTDLLNLILYFLIIDTSITLVIILFARKRITSQYIINNDGIYKNNNPEYLLKLNEIHHFLIKNPSLNRLFKKDAPTIEFYKDLSGKAVFKIPTVKNYSELNDKLIDVLYLSKKSELNHYGLYEKNITPISDKEIEKTPPITSEINIDYTLEPFKYITSYLMPNEKIINHFGPNNQSLKREFILKILSALFPLIVILISLCLILIMFNTKLGYYLEVMSFITGIFLLMIIMTSLISICPIINQINTYYKLKKTDYILTSHKIIMKVGEKIEFLALENIQNISISTSKFFKANVGNITIECKQKQRVLIANVPKWFILNSIENPQKIQESILWARDYIKR